MLTPKLTVGIGIGLVSVACFTEAGPRLGEHIESYNGRNRIVHFLESHPITFAEGRVRLLPASLESLDSLATILAETQDVSLRIAGYAFTSGDGEVNRELGQHRAEAVRVHLALRGVPTSRLAVEAPGDVGLDGEDRRQRHIVVHVD